MVCFKSLILKCEWLCYMHWCVCMHIRDSLSLWNSLQRISRCRSTIKEWDWGQEWLMVCFKSLILKCEWLCYMHWCVCMHIRDSLSLWNSLQRISRCSSTIKEWDWGQEWLMVCFKSLTYCLSCWSVNDCVTCYLYMHRSDYMSLSDSLQRVLCFICTMIELDWGKEWLMVCS
jgi:hypothetical protein